MSFQSVETIELGEIKVSRQKTIVFEVPHIATSVVVLLYDKLNQVAGVAHIVLPESAMVVQSDEETLGKYADLAIPALVDAFIEEGGQLATSNVRMAGGAQLFNFGGGSGNTLNIGARNAAAVQTGMMKYGMAIDKSDIGGNKARSLKFLVATGQATVTQIGGASTAL